MNDPELAAAIQRLADVHEEGFEKLSKSIDWVGDSIGSLSDVDNGIMINSYSGLGRLGDDIAEAIDKLATAIRPDTAPKKAEAVKKTPAKARKR